jgi:hypothetical protein
MIAAVLLAATTMAAPTTAETDAIFSAAGGTRTGNRWRWCADDPVGKMRIDLYRDLNGDGLVDVVVAQDKSQCHVIPGQAFALVAQGPKGKWRRLFQSTGVAEVLDPRMKGMWPDIRIVISGNCYPIFRWNGRAYGKHRTETALGKPCRLI